MDSSMIRLACAVFALVFLGVIVLRRRKKVENGRPTPCFRDSVYLFDRFAAPQKGRIDKQNHGSKEWAGRFRPLFAAVELPNDETDSRCPNQTVRFVLGPVCSSTARARVHRASEHVWRFRATRG